MKNQQNQGHLMSFFDIKENSLTLQVLEVGRIVWPSQYYVEGNRSGKPHPLYRGSARIEGNDASSLAKIWLDQGFRPCVVFTAGVRLLDSKGVLHTYKPEGGLALAGLVRLSCDGQPELRIVTQEGSEAFQTKYVWKRVPVRATGKTKFEQMDHVRSLLEGSRREGENLPAEPITELEVSDDPFADVV